jgi:hypothetical protein
MVVAPYGLFSLGCYNHGQGGVGARRWLGKQWYVWGAGIDVMLRSAWPRALSFGQAGTLVRPVSSEPTGGLEQETARWRLGRRGWLAVGPAGLAGGRAGGAGGRGRRDWLGGKGWLGRGRRGRLGGKGWLGAGVWARGGLG